MQHQHVSRFTCKNSDGSFQGCDIDFYFTPDRQEVVVYLNVPRHAPQPEWHRMVNQFYRQHLYRLLTPASRLTFYVVDAHQQCQFLHLGGLPGGYTSSHVDTHRQVLPASRSGASGSVLRAQ
ncbi:hypothetical protein [Deinococcus misasensis]|uniref:hypothetical protein n=1 Tax=Deinococcus misasensis TaxID=392413 RepID=UPI000B16142F|nr:hypothetical protein [Deinococcus misasensis]